MNFAISFLLTLGFIYSPISSSLRYKVRLLEIFLASCSRDLSLWTLELLLLHPTNFGILPFLFVSRYFFLFCFQLFLWPTDYIGICCLIFQFSSVTQSGPPLWNPMDCSTPGFPVHHQLPELTLTHVHWVSDAIQPSHPLSPSPPVFNLSQHQGLSQWVRSSHQVAKVLQFQLQHKSLKWIFRTDFL